jgi:hypothetical protein
MRQIMAHRRIRTTIMNLFVYYRISDKGRPKEKLPNGNKFSCLSNAVKEFGSDNIFVIADNCQSQTINYIKEHSLQYEETSLGNSASFLYTINKILKIHKPEDLVYLLEDDYLHRSGSKDAILEGLNIADYVTLYDHPDKYLLSSNGGNSFNSGKLHTTRLYVTKTTHWRETNSTTMTFACKVQTLKDNYAIWKKNTKTNIPDDFYAFIEITQKSLYDVFLFFFLHRKRIFLTLFRNWFFRKKTKRIISSVPAMATHTEVKTIAPVIKWENII